MNCATCARFPEMKNVWGCEEPAQEEVARFDWYPMPERESYGSCPILFISPSIREFEKRMIWAEEHGAKLDFDEVPRAYLDAFFAFKAYFSYCQAEIVKRRPTQEG